MQEREVLDHESDGHRGAKRRVRDGEDHLQLRPRSRQIPRQLNPEMDGAGSLGHLLYVERVRVRARLFGLASEKDSKAIVVTANDAEAPNHGTQHGLVATAPRSERGRVDECVHLQTALAVRPLLAMRLPAASTEVVSVFVRSLIGDASSS